MPDHLFSVVHDDSDSSLTVVGEVDESYAAALRDAIEHHSVSYTRDLVLDLSEVTFLPSVAVGVIAASLSKFRASDTALELVAVDGSIAQRVLTVCALPHRTA